MRWERSRDHEKYGEGKERITRKRTVGTLLTVNEELLASFFGLVEALVFRTANQTPAVVVSHQGPAHVLTDSLQVAARFRRQDRLVGASEQLLFIWGRS